MRKTNIFTNFAELGEIFCLLILVLQILVLSSALGHAPAVPGAVEMQHKMVQSLELMGFVCYYESI